ncbi:MAG: histidine--tRNA ligase [Syntrophomonas sp.]|nr:histidine--tRNA ligase [Syntrophomonas sp.]
MEIRAPRGTYDILPSQSVKWQYIEKILRETAAGFGYREIRTPMFEHTELFERGVGDTTDIVTKEMYSFLDKSSRSLTLRPEGTASCARALIENRIYSGVLPVKWYYTGPMFRYDRPQTGRYRQFHQFGVEVFGSHSPYVDGEVILLLIRMLEKLGLQDCELHLNSVGCPVCRETYRQKLVSFIEPRTAQLCDDCRTRYDKNPLRVLDCKERTCQAAVQGFPHIIDSLCNDCANHYGVVKASLTEMGVAYVEDHNLVRGLDYYTNTAFEVHIPSIGTQSAVGGGGRYDGLVSACGGPATPGIGFALGLERVLLAMDRHPVREWPDLGLDVLLVVLDENLTVNAMHLLDRLRVADIRADRDYNGRSMKAQLKFADKLGARMVVLMGEDEVERGVLPGRSMDTGQQQEVPQEDLIALIKRILA